MVFHLPGEMRDVTLLKKTRMERKDGDDFMRLKFAPRFPVIAELSDFVPSCKLR